MKKNKVLVTGGAGFIGSNVNKQLSDAGYESVVIDNLSKGNKKAVTRGIFVEGDLQDRQYIKEILKNYEIDAVMHFAAWIDVGESVIAPAKYYKNNVCNTLNLLDAMVECGIKNLVFSSTAAIFGAPETEMIDEDHRCNPLNPYGESKLIIEKAIKDYHKAYGLKACCLRYFNAAGGDPELEVKNFKVKENNLVPIILRSILFGDGSVTVFGNDYPTRDGTCIRDYIHVYDLGQAHLLSLEKLLNEEEETLLHYNLGNGQGFSVYEVIAAAEEVTKRKVKIIQGGRRNGDPAQLIANAEKAKRELGWYCRYPDLITMIEHAQQTMIERS